MKLTMFVIATLLATAAQASGSKALVQSGYWAGDNMNSSSPAPHCACDKDRNVRDCQPVQDTVESVGYICYDEFIPDDSRGWVHAEVYAVKQY